MIDETAIVRELRAMRAEVAGLREHQENVNRVIIVLMARLGDPTHVTVEEAARIRGVSETTIRRQIRDGMYTLETIPGTKMTGIPLSQIYGRWIDLQTARKAMERE